MLLIKRNCVRLGELKCSHIVPGVFRFHCVGSTYARQHDENGVHFYKQPLEHLPMLRH